MMKLLKKGSLVALALILCTSSIASTNVGAVGYNYYKGDINNDGVINSRDLLYFNSFFNGHEAVDGYIAERFDLDRNYVINVCDYEYLKDILLGNKSTSQVNSVNTNALPSNASVTYNVYNPTTGTRTNRYTLYFCPPMNLNSEPVSTCGTINGDGRLIQNGMQGVVNVQLVNGSNHGTAFVVDSHTILTAGHVLYNHETDSIYQNLKFKVFDDYNIPTDVTITPTSYHLPSNFSFSDDYVDMWDYGIVTVAQDLSAYINFDLGVMRSGDMLEDVFVTGFGGHGKQIDNVSQHLINTKSTGMGCLIEDDPYDDYFIRYDADMVKGDSGGPVWVYNAEYNKRTVIGINILECYERENSIPTRNLYNIGLRINTNILHAIYNNNYLNNNNNSVQ